MNSESGNKYDALSKKQYYISVFLKTCVSICAILGTFLSSYAGRDSFMGGTTVFMYFTIQSNLALALICGIGLAFMLKGRKPGKYWDVIKFAGTVSITLTGIVFCAVLAPTIGAKAWNAQNILTHVVVPVASIADFLIEGITTSIKKINVIWVLLPPFCYVIYAVIGFAANWQFSEGHNYPYFFLNWGSPAGAFGFTKEMPFMGCVWWLLCLVLFLICVGLGYLKLVDGIKKIADF